MEKISLLYEGFPFNLGVTFVKALDAYVISLSIPLSSVVQDDSTALAHSHAKPNGSTFVEVRILLKLSCSHVYSFSY